MRTYKTDEISGLFKAEKEKSELHNLMVRSGIRGKDDRFDALLADVTQERAKLRKDILKAADFKHESAGSQWDFWRDKFSIDEWDVSNKYIKVENELGRVYSGRVVRLTSKPEGIVILWDDEDGNKDRHLHLSFKRGRWYEEIGWNHSFLGRDYVKFNVIGIL